MLTLPAANMVVASRKEMVDMYDRLQRAALSQVADSLLDVGQGTVVGRRSEVDDERANCEISVLVRVASDSVLRHAY